MAKLVDYPLVAEAFIVFNVTITGESSDPCLTTTLTLPTTFTAVTITALSGVENFQEFAPATDTAATTAGNPSLCGIRVYSIVEVES
jgi:hypothetical protein